MDCKRRIQRGFSLIELVVALAVLGILVSIAMPSFVSVFNSNRLSSHSNEMLSALQLARMEAVRRNARVVVCKSDAPDLAPVCNAAGGDWSGWMAFVDDGGGGGTASDGVLNGGEIILRVGTFAAPIVLQASPAVSNGLQRIIFRPDGLLYSNAGNLLSAQVSFCIVTTSTPENVRDITIGSGARIGIGRRNAAGVCVAPADT